MLTKIKLDFTESEKFALIRSLIEYRSIVMEQGFYPDPVDEVLEKADRMRWRRGMYRFKGDNYDLDVIFQALYWYCCKLEDHNESSEVAEGAVMKAAYLLDKIGELKIA